METDRLAKLTEGQKACLRGVLRHMSSKDIARELDISPHTVDQRLRLAMRALGAGSRVQAAFMLARHEGLGEYQPTAYQSSDIAPSRLPGTLPPVQYERQKEQQLEPVREAQAAFGAALPFPRQTLRLPLPTGGTRPHDIGTWQRTGWVVAITMGALITFGVFIAGLEALVRLAQAVN